MVTLDNGGAGRTELRFAPTPPGLGWAVEHVWIQGSGPTAASHGAGWRIVPDPAAHLIYVRPKAHPGSSLRLVGPRSRHEDIDRTARLFSVGLRLRPGVLPLLTGVPASRMLDRGLSLDRVGQAPRLWVDDLEGLGPDAVAGALCTALLRSLDPCAVDWRVRAATRALVGARGRCTADAVVRLTGIPARTLRGALSDGVGMGPKRVARLLRLHWSIGLGMELERGWARVAAEAGYADQAHLIRDFRALVGETPARFVARGA